MGRDLVFDASSTLYWIRRVLLSLCSQHDMRIIWDEWIMEREYMGNRNSFFAKQRERREMGHPSNWPQHRVLHVHFTDVTRQPAWMMGLSESLFFGRFHWGDMRVEWTNSLKLWNMNAFESWSWFQFHHNFSYFATGFDSLSHLLRRFQLIFHRENSSKWIVEEYQVNPTTELDDDINLSAQYQLMTATRSASDTSNTTKVLSNRRKKINLLLISIWQ